jgi:hypothetical protein
MMEDELRILEHEKKDIQNISPQFLLLDSTDIKFLCQIATKVSQCLLSMSILTSQSS